jgi:5-methylcytosine-specific restriction endonuclease McrA
VPRRRKCIEALCTRPAKNGARCEPCQLERNSNNYYLSPAWRRLRIRVIRRDHGRCAACPSTRRLNVHHVRSRKGSAGKDDPSNLLTLCHACHVRYEGDVRADRDTPHRRLIDHIAEQLLGPS